MGIFQPCVAKGTRACLLSLPAVFFTWCHWVPCWHNLHGQEWASRSRAMACWLVEVSSWTSPCSQVPWFRFSREDEDRYGRHGRQRWVSEFQNVTSPAHRSWLCSVLAILVYPSLEAPHVYRYPLVISNNWTVQWTITHHCRWWSLIFSIFSH